MPAFLFGVVCVLLRLTDVWSWWALLWTPVLLLAVGTTVCEWRLSAHPRWQMGILEWLSLIIAHVGLAASLFVIWLSG
ncbi:hypothetical protein ACFVGY_07065 [Streptomyces sp. NPDC127106]|uniref:hypothetical protein n=1 Tax=Streptomyces sp. NPDC127106 TaxID=3345360 RepID=UPI00363C89C8